MENYCLLYGITQFTETASAHYKMHITLINREGSQNIGTGLQRNMLHLLRLARAEVMVCKGSHIKVTQKWVGWGCRLQSCHLQGDLCLKAHLNFPPPGWREKVWPLSIYHDQGFSQVQHAACSHMLSLPLRRTSGLPVCVRIHKCLYSHLDQDLSDPTDPGQMGNLGPEGRKFPAQGLT